MHTDMTCLSDISMGFIGALLYMITESNRRFQSLSIL